MLKEWQAGMWALFKCGLVSLYVQHGSWALGMHMLIFNRFQSIISESLLWAKHHAMGWGYQDHQEPSPDLRDHKVITDPASG